MFSFIVCMFAKRNHHQLMLTQYLLCSREYANFSVQPIPHITRASSIEITFAHDT